MAFITLLGQKSSHHTGATVIDSNQSIITIKGITINVMYGFISRHSYNHHDHWTVSNPILTNHMQSFVTINNLPIFLIGDTADCGSQLCVDSQSKKPLQDFIQIS